MLARFPADEYPHLAEFTFGHVLQPGYDYGDEYEFGLGLILDGPERAHRTAQSPNRTAGDKSRTDTAAGTISYVNATDLHSVDKSRLRHRRGRLHPHELARLEEASHLP